jgi:hypothetical protein
MPSPGQPTLTWPLARRRAAAYALVMPPLVAGITAVAILLAVGPTEAEDRAGAIAGAVVAAVIMGVITVAATWEMAALAIRGGGFEATREGLRFRFASRDMLLPWADVATVGTERRTSGRRTYEVFALRVSGPGYRWPRRLSLWFSEPGCLCVYRGLLEAPADEVARGIMAAKAILGSPTAEEGVAAAGVGQPGRQVPHPDYAPRMALGPRPRRRVLGCLGGVGSAALVLFFIGAALEATTNPELSVAGSLFMALVMTGVAAAATAYTLGGRRS